MKSYLNTLLALSIAVAPISAQAGGLAPVIEEAPIIIEEAAPAASSSVPNYVVPLLLLGLVGLAVASNSGSDSASDGAKAIVTGE